MFVAHHCNTDQPANHNKTYRDMNDHIKMNHSTVKVHITFDFSEKILLPSLRQQLRQLNFVAVLKLELLGVF